MTLITPEAVSKIATLAHLSLEDNIVSNAKLNADSIARDLSNIIELVKQIDTADTENIEPMAHPLDASQRMNPDKITEANVRDQMQAIAPDNAIEAGLYLVPQVVE